MSQFVESLESRTHLTAVVTGSRTLKIEVIDNLATNVQVVVTSKNRFTISIDDQEPVSHTFRKIRGIRFFGGDGDDVFQVTHLARDPAQGIRENHLFTRRTTLHGGAGDDLLVDGYASSKINGGTGNDTIIGGGGADTIIGGAGNDYIDAGPPPDAPSKRDGADRVFAGSGDDTVLGGAGKDVIFGQDGNDVLYGGSNRDALYGNDGDDYLDGQGDRDIEYAGGQAGDVIANLNDTDKNSLGEMKRMKLYLERIIKAYVPSAWRDDARA